MQQEFGGNCPMDGPASLQDIRSGLRVVETWPVQLKVSMSPLQGNEWISEASSGLAPQGDPSHWS